LSLFTILREPIERIGSQAFYFKDCVGVKTIVQFIIARCPKFLQSNTPTSSAQDAYDSYEHCRRLENQQKLTLTVSNMLDKCMCFFGAYHDAIAELQTNADLWFAWFEASNKQAQWYHNYYKKNYYLERMFGGISYVSHRLSPTFNIALQCLEGKSDDRASNVNVLHELSAMVACVRNNFRQSIITEHILPMAKQLLRTHIDFIIMEKYGEYSTAGAIASVLGAEQHDIAHSLASQHVGAGKFSSSISSYRDIMPPSVVKYLETENAWDIEFYHYAVKVFEERAATEGWNRKRKLMFV